MSQKYQRLFSDNDYNIFLKYDGVRKEKKYSVQFSNADRSKRLRKDTNELEETFREFKILKKIPEIKDDDLLEEFQLLKDKVVTWLGEQAVFLLALQNDANKITILVAIIANEAQESFTVDSIEEAKEKIDYLILLSKKKNWL